jgi:mannose-6-phosphate isomerase-like protein (cupin superfamily)
MKSLIRMLLTVSWLFATLPALCEDRIDPTFLHRFVPEIREKTVDISTPTCHYKPIFGEGDVDTNIVKGVARFGIASIGNQGASGLVSTPDEEQVYVILEGAGVLSYGEQRIQLRQNDYVYLPPGITHGLSNPSDQVCRFIVMGFKIPPGTTIAHPEKVQLANINDVKKELVEGHPDSVLYQLLMGDTQSKRDRIAAGNVLTSLFLMEFAPGGTNLPHHHESEEEIYFVLEGSGEMVAGGGVSGIEGRNPAGAGDAYFFRLNCTVGFYNSSKPPRAKILAVRSLFPGCKR